MCALSAATGPTCRTTMPPRFAAESGGYSRRVAGCRFSMSKPTSCYPNCTTPARDPEELRQEAQGLAREFGLPGLPLGRVDTLAVTDLGRAGLVRAFLGEPLLVLLEDPTRGLLAPTIPAVLNRVAMTRDRGAAVVWLARNGFARINPSFPADQWLQLGSEGLMLRQAA